MSEPAAPFDEFAEAERPDLGSPASSFHEGIRAAFQGVSLATRWLALITAVLVLGAQSYRLATGEKPAFLWKLKSAVPLFAIGLSYICLMATVQRTVAQRVLGFVVGIAFIMWGMEQFIVDQEWISFIDDIVVLLFVFDLSLVIRAQSATCGRETNPV